MDAIPPPPNGAPPPPYEAVATATYKLTKAHEKWLVDQGHWAAYFWALEQSEQKKGAKKKWFEGSNIPVAFKAEFAVEVPLEVISKPILRFFTNRARKTKTGKLEPPQAIHTVPPAGVETPSQPTAQPEVGTSTTPATNTQVPPPPSTDIPAAGPAPSASANTPLGTPPPDLYGETFKDEIKEEATKRADGQGGGSYLTVYQAVLSEQFNSLSREEKSDYEDKAKAASELQSQKPPLEHLLSNQEALAGDVAFVVHTIKPTADSKEPDIRMASITGMNSKPFKVAEEHQEQWEELFLQPLKDWYCGEASVKDKGKGKAQATSKTLTPPPTEDISKPDSPKRGTSVPKDGQDGVAGPSGAAVHTDGEEKAQATSAPLEDIPDPSSQNGGAQIPKDGANDLTGPSGAAASPPASGNQAKTDGVESTEQPVLDKSQPQMETEPEKVLPEQPELEKEQDNGDGQVETERAKRTPEDEQGQAEQCSRGASELRAKGKRFQSSRWTREEEEAETPKDVEMAVKDGMNVGEPQGHPEAARSELANEDIVMEGVKRPIIHDNTLIAENSSSHLAPSPSLTVTPLSTVLEPARNGPRENTERSSPTPPLDATTPTVAPRGNEASQVQPTPPVADQSTSTPQLDTIHNVSKATKASLEALAASSPLSSVGNIEELDPSDDAKDSKVKDSSVGQEGEAGIQGDQEARDQVKVTAGNGAKKRRRGGGGGASKKLKVTPSADPDQAQGSSGRPTRAAAAKSTERTVAMVGHKGKKQN
ncbi:hypothetical protein V5O48_011162 [Marasmius crinis-equi]|uniref:Uncharacterized protein n=1 Tax=Marasmius crinis-equi TaxID=585013 RepID=A0ABR3F6I1_9AGAR